jgi:hypothetical protein
MTAANPAAERVEQLIALTGRLTDLIGAECRAFEARRPHEAAATLEETSKLANLYRHESMNIRADKSLLDGAPLHPPRALIRSTVAIHAVLAPHAIHVQASKVVTEGIVRAVAEETIRNRNTGAGYGSNAAATTASGAAVTLNRRA